ncbi:MAG: alpha-2-macroglobulin, partial [Chitinophagaceae bacterium]|nr:alpha-2-macroglobulin [Chitinophagaceae bacterium]
MAQIKPNDYKNSWKKIDSLVNKKGLTQSALAEVDKIYALAKKEKNDAQIIKALLYRMNLQQVREEDALQKNIRELEKEIATATDPSKSLMNSIVAESYWSYFQQYRWQLYNRTQTVNFKNDDITTWGIADFHQKISELYLASLRNEKLLQQTKLETFDAIIIKGNARHLRPTLYDLLAHRALNYFKNDERNLNKPAYAFEINDAAAFAEASVFAGHRFITKDTQSLHFKALQLYQRLIEFHLTDSKPDALLDADIDRIEFVHAHGVMADKEELYRKSLENITSKYNAVPAAAQAWYLIAQIHANKAQQYDASKDTMYRFEWFAAKKICDGSTSLTTASEGRANCQNLLNEILRKEMSFQTEKVNIPGEPFRILVNYRNFSQMHFRIVKMDKAMKEKLGNNSWEDDYWKKILQFPSIKNFLQALPDTKDHQKHSVEIKADGLPVGEYALLASINNDFTLSKNNLAVQFFHVSNIAFINNGTDYFALHRGTGQPLFKASVQIWHRNYDYTKQKYIDRRGASLTADKNGFFKIQTVENSTRNSDNSLRLELTHNKDHLFLDDYTYHYFPGEPIPSLKETKNAFLFTDRSIYRPGQTVYFKGIVVNRHQKETESSIVPNWQTRLILYDVNGQKIDSIAVTTNEFGSYSGKFSLPANLLNGAFILRDEKTADDIPFSVEEYKRPKFFVEIKKPSGTYKVNDEISVTGNAKAYAGNNINEALVKYRVIRKIMIPFWRHGYGKYIWPPRSQDQMEIANGEVSTDANGEFIIKFKAIPDNTLSKKDQPVFYYEVTADVSDLNGETRSSATTVAVAYQALQIKIDMPDKMHTDSMRTIKIATTNLNDIFEKASVTVSIYSLKTPDRIFRQRYWQRPDQFVMTREEYYKLFPYDIYSDEDDVSKWQKAEKVFEKTDTTTNTSQFALSDSRSVGSLQLKAGWYIIEAATKDKNDEEVKAIRYVQLYNNTVISPAAFGSIESDKALGEPGEKISYGLSTNLDNVFIIHDLVRDTAKQRIFIQFNQTNQFNQQLAVVEKDRGGIHLNMAFVKHNRVYADNMHLDIPFTNKQLNISFETYRDKTLPGSDEKWKVKISGYKTDQVAAELLTTMYDASLDQFKPHSWLAPSLWRKNISAGNWIGQNNFSAGQSQEKNSGDDNYASFDKRYDELAFSRSVSRGEMIRVRGAAPSMDANKPQEFSKALQGRLPGVNIEEKESSANQAADTAVPPSPLRPSEPPASSVQIRKNFNETAFFLPDLKTDAAGNIEFSFTMPEALTQWKWMLLAHSKDLSFGLSEKTIITQKELMVQPNPPRFMREGDRMDFSGKVVNLSSKELTGQVELQLIDPSTNQPIDGWFRNMFPNQYFTAAAGQSVPVNFSIEIPFQYNRPVTYRMIASSGALKDGEEMMLPVVSNQMLVTESVLLPMRGNNSKQFKFEKLLKSGNSETLSHHALTVEFTGNPAWYAVQALPYLMEYPYECSEQNFNKFYANALAFKIANSSPRIKQIFESWKNNISPFSKGGKGDSSTLFSNLQKNQELKSLLLQETPWVLEAQNEAQQKKNIALLFDMVRMSTELESSLNKLQEMQTANGGFVWFKGGPDDRYITQYIITGIGHLQKLNAIPEKSKTKINAIIKLALVYLDKKLKEDYDYLIKHKVNLASSNIGYVQIQFLYMRSFFIN